MKFKSFVLFAVAIAITSSAYGQKYMQKPYSEWSQEDATKVVRDSPWATQYQSEKGLDQAAMDQQRREQADTRLSGNDRGNLGRPDAPIPIFIRLHSGMPVRQAIVRLQQINANYNKMSGDDKKKFDDGRAMFLNCAICKDYYVITFTKYNDTSNSVSDGIFQALKLEDLKGHVWLENDRGEKLEITQFTPPKNAADSAVLFFKRVNDKGESFYTAADKNVKLMFSNEFRDNKNEYSKLVPRVLEFKISKMVVDGELLF